MKNLGEHLNEVFADRSKMEAVINDLVLDGAIPASKQHAILVPNQSMDEFYLPLTAFDYSKAAKNGFFPPNVQFETHMMEFLKHGYRSSIGNCEVRFPLATGDRRIRPFTVGLDDGFVKILLMFSIVAFTRELEIEMKDDDGSLKRVLESFRSVRCSYTFFENPSHHFLHSLKTQWVTAEKQVPSPINIMADIKETIAVEKRLNRQGRGALKDILGKVIAEYNKFCSNKRHRIDSTRRSLIYNLFFNLHSETLSLDLLGTNWYATLTRVFFQIGCYRYQATMPGRSHTDVA
ncbi:unnamed protein product [Cladocopium goreaui]|uniref:Uncharacterized protein n=1 Tax=Cladocopium goreaui TaxID=2562237 RepID=A0A9P1G5F6_9DINO|nr:unnamed protein product [Cladocopium goreaui]